MVVKDEFGHYVDAGEKRYRMHEECGSLNDEQNWKMRLRSEIDYNNEEQVTHTIHGSSRME